MVHTLLEIILPDLFRTLLLMTRDYTKSRYFYYNQAQIHVIFPSLHVASPSSILTSIAEAKSQ